jgi:hypothetical protein
MTLLEPDWNKLREIRLRAEDLDGRNELTYDAWKALANEAYGAASECSDITGFLSRFAKRGWSQRLRAEQESSVPAA